MTIPPRVLIVSEHASQKFGGEASLPLHYFRGLRRRGIEAWMIVHERTKDELLALLPDETDRLLFLRDTTLNKLAWRIGQHLPAQVDYFTLGYLSRIATQYTARRLARALIREKRVSIVHQPIPVSPRETSLLYGVGAPVIIGPMNGNMDYPAGFRGSVKGIGILKAIVAAGRLCSGALHRAMPGKLSAAALLVANERTREGLPKGARGDVITLVENGVDLRVWQPAARQASEDDAVRFVFVGRLVDWKAVDVLLEAFARLDHTASLMEIIGDGPKRSELEALANRLGIAGRVHFSGWLSQQECAKRIATAAVLVLPSVYECGGAVVLEGMACGLPIVATNWGGPADYIDESCGFLVDPVSRDKLIEGFAAAMQALAHDPALRKRFGAAGRRRVKEHFDWEHKIDRMVSIYESHQRII